MKNILKTLYMLIYVPGYILAIVIGKADTMPTPAEMKTLLDGGSI